MGKINKRITFCKSEFIVKKNCNKIEFKILRKRLPDGHKAKQHVPCQFFIGRLTQKTATGMQPIYIVMSHTGG
jgi:hypothetical protein